MRAPDQRDGPECTISNMPQKQRCCPHPTRSSRELKTFPIACQRPEERKMLFKDPYGDVESIYASLSLNERAQRTFSNNQWVLHAARESIHETCFSCVYVTHIHVQTGS